MHAADVIFHIKENALRVPRVGFRILYRGLAPRRRARLEEAYVRRRIEHVCGPRHFAARGDTPVVATLVRDGGPYIDAFIDHYRRQGCREIAFMDTGSVDDTVARIRAHEGVALLRCDAGFRHFERAMRRLLSRRYARGRWCLFVDIDELFDYPRSDRLDMAGLLTYLEEGGYTALVAQMLDLCPDGAIGRGGLSRDDFRRDHRYYDLSHVRKEPYRFRGNRVSNPAIRTLRGGIRAQHFGLNRVLLTKHPLFLVNGRVRPFFNDVHEVAGARLADVSGVLYHYKFLDDFEDRVASALEHKQYWGGSVDYRYYQRHLERSPRASLRGPTAQELDGPDALVDQGFLTVSSAYDRFVETAASSGRLPNADRIER